MQRQFLLACMVSAFPRAIAHGTHAKDQQLKNDTLPSSEASIVCMAGRNETMPEAKEQQVKEDILLREASIVCDDETKCDDVNGRNMFRGQISCACVGYYLMKTEKRVRQLYLRNKNLPDNEAKNIKAIYEKVEKLYRRNKDSQAATLFVGEMNEQTKHRSDRMRAPDTSRIKKKRASTQETMNRLQTITEDDDGFANPSRIKPKRTNTQETTNTLQTITEADEAFAGLMEGCYRRSPECPTKGAMLRETWNSEPYCECSDGEDMVNRNPATCKPEKRKFQQVHYYYSKDALDNTGCICAGIEEQQHECRDSCAGRERRSGPRVRR